MMKSVLGIVFLIFCQMLNAQHNWVQTNPGGGGAIAMVSATADGTLVAASDLSGIYVSSNNGINWEVKGSSQGLTNTHISCLGFHPTDGGTFFMGTGEGVFKTTDGGNTIYPVSLEFDPNNSVGYVESIGMSLSDANVGYLAHYESWYPELSFMKTTDGGENWVKVLHDLPTETTIVKILTGKTDANLVYALGGRARFNCTEPYLYRSTNGGQNWTQIATDIGDVLDFDLHPTDPNTIFVSTFVKATNACDQEFWQYALDTGELYKSENGGTSFNQIGDYSGVISVYDDPNHITVTDMISTGDWNEDAGTWTTLNGGFTWTHTGFVGDWSYGWAQIDYAYTTSFNGLNKTITKDLFHPERLYASFGQWAWSSLDGGNNLLNVSTQSLGGGQYLTTGLENIVANALDVNDSDPNVIYAGYYDIGFWYSVNHGLSWKKSYPDNNIYPDYTWWNGGGTNNNFILSDPENPNVVWATFGANNSSTVGALFKSTEYGENWILSSTGLNLNLKNMHGISIDLNSPVGNRILYLTLDGDVYKSYNDGVTWNLNLTNGGLKFTEVDHFNSNLIYAGGENGFWRSIDAGQTWAEVGLSEMRFSTTVQNPIIRDDIVPTFDVPWNNPPVVAWQGIFEIKADPNIANRVYATAYGPGKGLYRSDNGGLDWIKLYTNDKMRGVAIAPQNSDIIYVSSSLCYHSGGWDESSEGFLMSTDAGSTWTSVNDAMAWTNGGRMEIEHGDEPFIWGVSPGTGLQYADISSYFETTDVIAPVRSDDISVYPNPASNLLFVKCQLRTNIVKIISIEGKVLLTTTFGAGEHSINVASIPSGIYMIEVNGVDSEKVVIE